MKILTILTAILLAGFATATAGELVVDIPFDASQLQLDQFGMYTRVIAPGLPSFCEEGLPMLPRMPVRVALPTGCRATSVDVVSAEYGSLDGRFTVMPADEPVPFSVDQEIHPVEPDPHIYGHDRVFPFEMVEFGSSSALWGIPVATLTVHPVRWNPLSGNL